MFSSWRFQIYFYDRKSALYSQMNLPHIQYLDLDLDSDAAGGAPGPLTTPPANACPSATPYKTIDFLKTEAFNRTREEVEEKRKEWECPDWLFGLSERWAFRVLENLDLGPKEKDTVLEFSSFRSPVSLIVETKDYGLPFRSLIREFRLLGMSLSRSVKLVVDIGSWHGLKCLAISKI